MIPVHWRVQCYIVMDVMVLFIPLDLIFAFQLTIVKYDCNAVYPRMNRCVTFYETYMQSNSNEGDKTLGNVEQ